MARISEKTREAMRRTNTINALAAHGMGVDDYEALRRISMTLRRWHELECGDSDNYKSWSIERDGDEPDSKPYMVYHIHQGSYGYAVYKQIGDKTFQGVAAGRTFSTKEKALAFAEKHGISEPLIKEARSRREPIADRETGARKRLAAIMARHPTLAAYVQGDPRGCALHILRPGDVPEGQTADSCYSRGIAIY